MRKEDALDPFAASARRWPRTSDDERPGLYAKDRNGVYTLDGNHIRGLYGFHRNGATSQTTGRHAVLKPLRQVHRFDHERKQGAGGAVG
jgi:hypothetical protein